MKRTTKNAFTLIELLAVIVILAIIALIAVPVIINIIDKANKSAFKDSAYSIISAGELYFAERQLDLEGMKENKTFTFPNATGLELKGKLPESGWITVNTEGKVSLSISNGRYCVTKGFDDKDVTLTEGKCNNNPSENNGLPIIWNAGSSVAGLVSVSDQDGNIVAYKISDFVGSIDSLEGVDFKTLINGVENNLILSTSGTSPILKAYDENLYSIYDMTFVCTTSECNLGTFTLPESGTYISAQVINLVSFSIGKPKETELVENGIMKSTNSCIKSGTCNAGTEVKVAVNSSETYNFYVLKDTGSEITLIMDRNIGTQVAWYKDSDDTTNNESNNVGPLTALNYLNTQTNAWTNIPAIENYEYINNENGTTNTYGYQKLNIINGTGVLTSRDGSTTNITGTSRARMFTSEEVNDLITSNLGMRPIWLYTNLSGSNTIDAPYGYWSLTSTTYTGSSSNNIFFPSNSGIDDDVDCDTNFGVRPVITLSK